MKRSMANLSVQVWSDIACPWCYVGKRHLEAALAGWAHSSAARVQFRSFELDPTAAPRLNSEKTYVERLAAKYGNGVPAAQAMVDRMTALGASKGIDFDFKIIQSGNTFLAHQLLHWAASQTSSVTTETLVGRGAQPALKERLMRAYFCEGAAIGESTTLVQLAVEVGLDEEGAHNALSSGSFAADVRADESAAHSAGISGVPFFGLGRYGVSGAQPVEVLTRALEQAWDGQQLQA